LVDEVSGHKGHKAAQSGVRRKRLSAVLLLEREVLFGSKEKISNKDSSMLTGCYRWKATCSIQDSECKLEASTAWTRCVYIPLLYSEDFYIPHQVTSKDQG